MPDLTGEAIEALASCPDLAEEAGNARRDIAEFGGTVATVGQQLRRSMEREGPSDRHWEAGPCLARAILKAAACWIDWNRVAQWLLARTAPETEGGTPC